MAEREKFLTDEDLIQRWSLNGSPSAIKKLLYRLRNAKGERHLKHFKPTRNRIRYRVEDVEKFEKKNLQAILLHLSGSPPTAHPRPQAEQGQFAEEDRREFLAWLEED